MVSPVVPAVPGGHQHLLQLFDFELAMAMKFVFFPTWPRPRPVIFKINYHEIGKTHGYAGYGLHRSRLYARAIRLFGPLNQRATLAREQALWVLTYRHGLGLELVSIIRQMVLVGEPPDRWTYWPGTQSKQKEYNYEGPNAGRLTGNVKEARRTAQLLRDNPETSRRQTPGFFHPFEVSPLGELSMMVSGSKVDGNAELRPRIIELEETASLLGHNISPLFPPKVDTEQPHSLVFRVDVGKRVRERVLSGFRVPQPTRGSRKGSVPLGFITVPNDGCVSKLGPWLIEHFGKVGLKGKNLSGWHVLEVFDRAKADSWAEAVDKVLHPGQQSSHIERPDPPQSQSVSNLYHNESKKIENVLALLQTRQGGSPSLVAASAAPQSFGGGMGGGYAQLPSLPTPLFSGGGPALPRSAPLPAAHPASAAAFSGALAQLAATGMGHDALGHDHDEGQFRLLSLHVGAPRLPSLHDMGWMRTPTHETSWLDKLEPVRTVFFLSHMTKPLMAAPNVPACHAIHDLENNGDDPKRVTNDWHPNGYWQPRSVAAVGAPVRGRKVKALVSPLYGKQVLGSHEALRASLTADPHTAHPAMPKEVASSIDPAFGAGRALLVTRPCALADALPSMSEIGHPAVTPLRDYTAPEVSKLEAAGSQHNPMVAQLVLEHCGDDVLILTLFSVQPRLKHDHKYPVINLCGRRTNDRRFLDTF